MEIATSVSRSKPAWLHVLKCHLNKVKGNGAFTLHLSLSAECIGSVLKIFSYTGLPGDVKVNVEGESAGSVCTSIHLLFWGKKSRLYW